MVQGIDKIIMKALDGFFDSVGLKQVAILKSAPNSNENNTLFSASVGFAGEKLKGAFVVTCPRLALEKTHPQREHVANISDDDLSDWSGEIANQIVGLIKRFAAGYDVSFSIGTPTVIKGRDLAISKTGKTTYESIPILIDGLSFNFHFNVKTAQGVSFEGEPRITADQPANGDALFF